MHSEKNKRKYVARLKIRKTKGIKHETGGRISKMDWVAKS
jgi:hypothetical protein